MKYKNLTLEELKHLEEELKQFLILNHVYAEEWETLNKENPTKAKKLVSMFSDQVFEKIYNSISYLENRKKDSCFVFHFKEVEIELILIQRKHSANEDIQLNTLEGIHTALTSQVNELRFFTQQKKYTEERAIEIHKMLEQGCIKSSAEFWNALKEVIEK